MYLSGDGLRGGEFWGKLGMKSSSESCCIEGRSVRARFEPEFDASFSAPLSVNKYAGA